MPREIGLAFATPSILAMLEVPPRKSKTRRIPSNRLPNVGDIVWAQEGLEKGALYSSRGFTFTKYPHYSAIRECNLEPVVIDGERTPWRWKRGTLPSIFMPKDCARIWLRVTDKRLEPLQAITYEDILAEGWNPQTSEPITEETAGEDARAWFIALWNSLAKPGERWEDNPEVAVIGYEILSTEGRPEREGERERDAMRKCTGKWEAEMPEKTGHYFFFESEAEWAEVGNARFNPGNPEYVRFFRGILQRGGLIYSQPMWMPRPPGEADHAS